MNDLISRQAAIDALHMHLIYRMGTDSNKKRLDDWINSLPSAQPERKKGKWINEGRIVRCSKCKIGYAAVKGMKSALTYNFCPHCGADMRGAATK